MRLMIIGSLDGHISAAGKIALQRGAKVGHAEDWEEALAALRNGRGADLIMIDIKQPVARLIEALESERFNIPVVACGIGTDAPSAVKAIQAGAKEYVPLPPDAELIAAVIEAVTEENDTMIADDPAMQKVLHLARQIAPSEATVLITGESGTGKEVMSRFIHTHSKRKDGAFIALNCAAIPENLLESELFGHEKGAFTGAVARRIGKFEEASGGTLLLDEVTEMHPSLQAKLLRAIQERVIDRVGGKAPVKVDVRIIATSNVRELENTMHRAILISMEAEIEESAIHTEIGTITHEWDKPKPKDTTSENPVGTTVADMEKQLILNTLDHCLGNRTQAAKILGISIRTLRNKLKHYGADDAA